MIKHSIVIALLVATGCKDKQPAKQAPPPPKTPPSVTGVWLDKLPELAASSPLVLQDAVGFVGIAADGSLTVGAKFPDKEASLDGLAKALDIPAAEERHDNAFAAVEGDKPGLENPTDIKFAKLGHPALASGSPAPPQRLTSAFALAHPDSVSGGVIVLADANAPAAVLVAVLSKVGGFVAVRNGKTLAALPIAIDRHAPAAIAPTQRWHELRLTAPIELEVVPSPASQVPALGEVGKAVGALKTDAIDVLVAPETKVQELVAVIGALRASNVDAFGFGKAPAPNSPDATARGHAGNRVIAWNFAFATGDRQDPAPFRAALDATLPAMQQCYAATLAKNPSKKPNLAKTARASFALSADQKLSAISATEVDAPTAKCIVDALKSAKFPSPGGGGAQAELRITFLPD